MSVTFIDPFEFTGLESQTFFASETFTVPAGVTSISALCVGGGSSGVRSDTAADGGRGGGMAGGTITVTPGEVLTVTVGSGGAAATVTDTFNSGSPSSIARGATVLLRAHGGSGRLNTNSTNLTTGLGSAFSSNGGFGGAADATYAGGGGGAAGYNSDGAPGVEFNSAWSTANSSGYGGAGGEDSTGTATGGGGTGIWGRGAPGLASGIGGSFGTNGATRGGIFGGGGGGNDASSGSSGEGGQGAVRIVWGNLSYGSNGTGTATKVPTLVGSVSGSGALSSGGTINIGTIPVKAGDVIVGVVGNGSIAVTPFSGFTSISSVTTTPRLGVSVLTATSGLTSITLSANISADQSYILAVFRDVSARLISRTAARSSTESIPNMVTISSSTIGVKNALLLHALSIVNSQSNLTPPDNWISVARVQRNNGTEVDGTVSLIYRVKTDTNELTGSGDLEYNDTTALNWRGLLFILSPGEYTTT